MTETLSVENRENLALVDPANPSLILLRLK